MALNKARREEEAARKTSPFQERVITDALGRRGHRLSKTTAAEAAALRRQLYGKQHSGLKQPEQEEAARALAAPKEVRAEELRERGEEEERVRTLKEAEEALL